MPTTEEMLEFAIIGGRVRPISVDDDVVNMVRRRWEWLNSRQDIVAEHEPETLEVEDFEVFEELYYMQ